MSARPLRRFTIEEYYRMVEAGVLRADEPVELLDGIIVLMMPASPLHNSVVNRLNRILQRLDGDRWLMSVKGPVEIPSYSEPQPDLALLQPRADFYTKFHPRPEDIFLLIEVSDSTLLIDREDKLPIYARAGIREVWIINLCERIVEIYTSPSNGAYTQTRQARPGDALAPLAFPDAAIDTRALLGAVE